MRSSRFSQELIVQALRQVWQEDRKLKQGVAELTLNKQILRDALGRRR